MAPLGDGFQQSYAWRERRGNPLSSLPMSGSVQVNDARLLGAEPTARPEGVREEGPGSNTRGPGFRTKLAGKRGGDGLAPDQISTVGLGAILRPEPPEGSVTAPGSALSGREPRQVLVGGTASSAEARVHFGAGALAGSEIRLATSQGGVTAELLTPTNESRQTLLAVMDEVRWRLWRKGLALSRGSAAAKTPTDAGRERSNR